MVCSSSVPVLKQERDQRKQNERFSEYEEAWTNFEEIKIAINRWLHADTIENWMMFQRRSSLSLKSTPNSFHSIQWAPALESRKNKLQQGSRDLKKKIDERDYRFNNIFRSGRLFKLALIDHAALYLIDFDR